MSGAGRHAAVDTHAYCRAVEAHLCRQNGGHLIRIVGPAFDLVKGWAEAGIPLAITCAGIDRCVDRAARKPGRRRPMRVEFCDADVLAAHDEWTRAVSSAGIGRGGEVATGGPKRASLTQHLDRAITQLTALRGSGRAPAALEPALAAAITALDDHRATAATARGGARDTIVEALRGIEITLNQAAVEAVGEAERIAMRRDAEHEIAAFRGRLAPGQWESALATATARLIRLRLGLPAVAFE